jgi:acyl carrier protein
MDDMLTERVQELVASTFGLDPASVPADASAKSLPAWSSLAQLRLLSAVEREFGVKLTTTEMLAMNSILAITQVLAAKGVEV